MATNNNIKHYTAADIEKYHKGQLSTKERHDLEKAALDDPFLADALEGYAVAGVNATADLAELKKRLADKTATAKVIPLEDTNKKKAFPWLRVAVMMVILVGAAILANQFLFKNDRSEEIAQVPSKPKEVNTVDNTPKGSTADTGTNSATITELKKSPASTVTSGNEQPSATTIESVGVLSNADAKTNEGDLAVKISPKKEDPIKNLDVRDEATKVKSQKDDAKEDLARSKNKTAPAEKRETDKELVVTATDVPAGYKKYNEEAKGAVANRKTDNNQFRANTFYGYVTDNNNRGVPFANVTNTRDNVGTYTDASGRFTLTSPDTVLNVQIRSVGLENNVVQLRNNVPLNQVVLQEDRSDVVINNLDAQKPNAERRRQDANLKLEEPEPADGWDNYDTYLTNNLNVPPEFKTRQDGKQEVEVSFEVDKNGKPTNIRVEKSLCKSCDEEAKRLVKDGPKWKRKAKKGRTTVTITF